MTTETAIRFTLNLLGTVGGFFVPFGLAAVLGLGVDNATLAGLFGAALCGAAGRE